MTLPNADRTVVQERKLTAYLLALDHPDGGAKARFLRAHGFDLSNTARLAAGLR